MGNANRILFAPTTKAIVPSFTLRPSKDFCFFFKHPHPASYPHSFADNSTPRGLRLVSKEKSKRTR